MRILIYCVDFYPNESGYSHAFQNFIRAISENGEHEIDVVTPVSLNGYDEISIGDAKIIRWPRKERVGFRKIPGSVFLSQILFSRRIVRLDGKNNYDVIFFETIEEIFLLATLPTRLFSKLLVRIHAAAETEFVFLGDDWRNKVKKVIAVSVVAKKLKYISATSKYYIEFIKRHLFEDNVLQISRKEFFVIHNCIKVFDTGGPAKSNGQISILSLGRMNDAGVFQKGFTDFLVALSILPITVRSRLDVVIVGSGDKRDFLIRLAMKLGLEQVRFIETISNSEVQMLLSKCDFVVLPSRFEGQSMFALEAISKGAIVVFGDVGGLRDLVDGNGRLVEPKNIRALADAIDELIKVDASNRAVMRRQSITIAREKFGSLEIYRQFVFSVNIMQALEG